MNLFSGLEKREGGGASRVRPNRVHRPRRPQVLVGQGEGGAGRRRRGVGLPAEPRGLPPPLQGLPLRAGEEGRRLCRRRGHLVRLQDARFRLGGRHRLEGGLPCQVWDLQGLGSLALQEERHRHFHARHRQVSPLRLCS